MKVHKKQLLLAGLTFARLVKVLDLSLELLLLLVAAAEARVSRQSDKGPS